MQAQHEIGPSGSVPEGGAAIDFVFSRIRIEIAAGDYFRGRPGESAVRGAGRHIASVHGLFRGGLSPEGLQCAVPVFQDADVFISPIRDAFLSVGGNIDNIIGTGSG